MKKFIEDLLYERKQTKTWLAGKLGIKKQSLNKKFKNDCWNMKDFIKIIEVFKLTDEEILAYMQKAREQQNESSRNI